MPSAFALEADVGQAHQCSTDAQNAAFAGFWQEAVKKHLKAASLFDEASNIHTDTQVRSFNGRLPMHLCCGS